MIKPADEKRWQQQYRDHDHGRHSVTAFVYCFTIKAIFSITGKKQKGRSNVPGSGFIITERQEWRAQLTVSSALRELRVLRQDHFCAQGEET